MRWLAKFQVGANNFEVDFVHGMCVGADEQAHKVAWALHYRIDGFPSNIAEKTMEVKREQFTYIHKPQAPLVRNRNIVEGATLLIAAPRQRKEEQRSGTWATIRYARERGLTTLMCWP